MQKMWSPLGTDRQEPAKVPGVQPAKILVAEGPQYRATESGKAVRKLVSFALVSLVGCAGQKHTVETVAHAQDEKWITCPAKSWVGTDSKVHPATDPIPAGERAMIIPDEDSCTTADGKPWHP